VRVNRKQNWKLWNDFVCACLKVLFRHFLQDKVKDEGNFQGLTSEEEDVAGQLFEALRYKPQSRGYDYRWRHWDFH
jgi:hypothetical protein